MWIIYGLGASIFWGLTYVINEYLYKHISVLSAVAISSLCTGIIVSIIALVFGNLSKDLVTIFSSSKMYFGMLLGITSLLIAEIFIGFSISDKNAAVAGIIEISYPIFVILFSYLLFRETHITFWAGVGCAFVFIGIALVYMVNR